MKSAAGEACGEVGFRQGRAEHSYNPMNVIFKWHRTMWPSSCPRTRPARTRRRSLPKQLESRTLLSTLGVPIVFDHGTADHDHRHANHVQTHDIGGLAHQFTWDDPPVAVDPAGGKLYFTDATDDVIRRVNLDGTELETRWSSPQPYLNGGLALDSAAGKMYWTDPGQHLILRADLDGSNVEPLVDLLPISGNSTGSTGYSFGIALDVPAGKMYWTDMLTKGVYRADLDGSKVALLSNGLLGLDGLLILPPTPAVRVSPRSGLITSETGGSTSFAVSLATPPPGRRVQERIALATVSIDRTIDGVGTGAPRSAASRLRSHFAP